MRVDAQFVNKDGRILWQENHDLPDHGCVYLCKNLSDETHAVYKLNRVPLSEPPTWAWSGLWNSNVIAGRKVEGKREWQHLFSSIEEAIGAMLANPEWKVWRANFDGSSYR